jgi:DNA-binding transcriptional regulator YhcF (GntR family)
MQDYDRRIPNYLQVVESIHKRLVKGEHQRATGSPPPSRLPSSTSSIRTRPAKSTRSWKPGMCKRKGGTGTFVTKDRKLEALRRETAGARPGLCPLYEGNRL